MNLSSAAREAERLVRRLAQTRVDGLRGVGRFRLKLRSRLGLFFQADQPLLAAKAIDVFLRQDGPQPALQRAAAREGVQLGDSPAIRRARSVKISIEGIRQLAGIRIPLHDGVRRVDKASRDSGSRKFPRRSRCLGRRRAPRPDPPGEGG